MKRRALLGAALAVPLAVVSGCAGMAAEPGKRWHRGRLAIGTGDPSGVYYQVGGGYADVIARHVTGYTAVAAPTGGSADNLMRLRRGDVQIALTFSDVATDAVGAVGTFHATPLAIRALARIYDGYAHLVVRKNARVGSVDELAGKRVSTSTHSSGTEFMALRILAAAGLDPDHDVKRVSLSLSETIEAMSAGTIDAMFFAGGLPTPGVTGLLQDHKDDVKFIPLADLLPKMNQLYGPAYGTATINKTVYAIPSSVPTLTVGNLITVLPEMPNDVAFDLTKVIFDYQSELAAVHPDWGSVTRKVAPDTDPVVLHPGATQYFATT